MSTYEVVSTVLLAWTLFLILGGGYRRRLPRLHGRGRGPLRGDDGALRRNRPFTEPLDD